MLEFVLTFIVFVLVFYVGNLWLSIVLTVILLILVLPGLYAMFFGAPFVPSSDKKLKNILKLGDFKKKDLVYDLGCGDGKVIRAVANTGVKQAIGYELSVPTYFLALFKKYMAKSKEKILFGNLWNKDYSKADVVICFLLQMSMDEFERQVWPKLKKGAKVISNNFKMPTVNPRRKLGGVYLYVKK